MDLNNYMTLKMIMMKHTQAECGCKIDSNNDEAII